MPDQVLLDNDVALKVACYSLVDETLVVTTIGDVPPGILGVGRFVIRGRLDRGSNIADVPRAKAAFERLLGRVELLEPDDDELAMAADLEAEASRRDLELDGGESQLLALLLKRGCRVLVTGDKRAIVAMAIVAAGIAADKIACLEQQMAMIVDVAGVDSVRSRVCAEPLIDRAVTSCFACTQDRAGYDDIAAGLSSYVGHLDRSAPGMLMHAFAANLFR